MVIVVMNLHQEDQRQVLVTNNAIILPNSAIYLTNGYSALVQGEKSSESRGVIPPQLCKELLECLDVKRTV